MDITICLGKYSARKADGSGRCFVAPAFLNARTMWSAANVSRPCSDASMMDLERDVLAQHFYGHHFAGHEHSAGLSCPNLEDPRSLKNPQRLAQGRARYFKQARHLRFIGQAVAFRGGDAGFNGKQSRAVDTGLAMGGYPTLVCSRYPAVSRLSLPEKWRLENTAARRAKSGAWASLPQICRSATRRVDLRPPRSTGDAIQVCPRLRFSWTSWRRERETLLPRHPPANSST